MAEETVEHENRGSRKEIATKLVSTLFGLAISIAAAYAGSGGWSASDKWYLAVTLAASFGAVLLQTLLALYLHRTRSSGARLKRETQAAYLAALDRSSLNPRVGR